MRALIDAPAPLARDEMIKEALGRTALACRQTNGAPFNVTSKRAHGVQLLALKIYKTGAVAVTVSSPVACSRRTEQQDQPDRERQTLKMIALALGTSILAAMTSRALGSTVGEPDEQHKWVPRAGQELTAVWYALRRPQGKRRRSNQTRLTPEAHRTHHSLLTADLGGGTQMTYGSGLDIFNDAGEHVWGEQYPMGYTPCINIGRSFSIGGGCMGFGGYKFWCESEFSGAPAACEVRDWADGTIAAGEGDADEFFFPVGAGSDGYCQVKWTTPEGYHCGAEDEGLRAFDRQDGSS